MALAVRAAALLVIYLLQLLLRWQLSLGVQPPPVLGELEDPANTTPFDQLGILEVRASSVATFEFDARQLVSDFQERTVRRRQVGTAGAAASAMTATVSEHHVVGIIFRRCAQTSERGVQAELVRIVLSVPGRRSTLAGE